MDKLKAIPLWRGFRKEGSAFTSCCGSTSLALPHAKLPRAALATSHISRFSKRPRPRPSQAQSLRRGAAESRSQAEGTAQRCSGAGDLRGAVPRLRLRSAAPRRVVRRKTRRVLFNCHLHRCLMSSSARIRFPLPRPQEERRGWQSAAGASALNRHNSTSHGAIASLKLPGAPPALQTSSRKHTTSFLSSHKDALMEKGAGHACTARALPRHRNVSSVYGSVIRDVVKYFLKSCHVPQSTTLHFTLLGEALLNCN